jgi:hypothetical protein
MRRKIREGPSNTRAIAGAQCPARAECRARRLPSGSELGERSSTIALRLPVRVSNGCAVVCQAESARWNAFLCAQEHIARNFAVAAAMGGVELPVGGADVVAAGVAQGVGGAVDCRRQTFEFQEIAHGSFVQVEVQVAQPETGAELFVAEGGAEAQGPQMRAPVPSCGDGRFGFEILFIGRRSGGRGRLFRRKPCSGQARAEERRGGRRFDSESQEAAAAAKRAVRRVKQSVAFENAAMGVRAQVLELADQAGQVFDPEFYFGLEVGGQGSV